MSSRNQRLWTELVADVSQSAPVSPAVAGGSPSAPEVGSASVLPGRGRAVAGCTDGSSLAHVHGSDPVAVAAGHGMARSQSVLVSSSASVLPREGRAVAGEGGRASASAGAQVPAGGDLPGQGRALESAGATVSQSMHEGASGVLPGQGFLAVLHSGRKSCQGKPARCWTK